MTTCGRASIRRNCAVMSIWAQNNEGAAMSLFHSLQDVYYDAMHLQEALEAIPSKCDCWDAEAHLSGRCCCVSAEGTVGGTMAFRQGCLHYLEKLNKSLT